ncbi:MAG TPA: RecX family transcriptional regulator [Ignavibacteria bacterium]|nr:RecX family transcriptional regulator [Ignavibacteria bacterium]
MKITSIEKQKKEGRYNIFLDGEFAFGLYKETIYEFGLRVNDELDPKKAEEIKTRDEIGFGKRVAYRFLNYKQRSEKEVRKKLKEKKLSESSIDVVISSLKDLKYINDESYAKSYLQSKILRKPEGKRVLKMKLADKGIPKEIAENIISEQYPPETETEKAAELLKKYEKKVRAKTPVEKKQKCFRFLLSKGFDFDTINEVLRQN